MSLTGPRLRLLRSSAAAAPARGTCPVCGRPVAPFLRCCPYCDEPLPPDRARRRDAAFAAGCLLAGGLLLLAAPAGRPPSATAPMPWPPGLPGLVLAFVLGGLAGAGRHLPLPLLLLLAGVPETPVATAAGAYLAGAICPFPHGAAAAPRKPARSDPDWVLLGTLAGWALAATFLPRVLFALRLLLRVHAAWLLGALAFAAALQGLSREGISPGSARAQGARMLTAGLPRMAGFLILLAAGFRAAAIPGGAFPAAAGLFLLAPLLATMPADAEVSAWPGIPPLAHTVFRASLFPLLLLALRPAGSVAAAAAALLTLAAAAAAMQALRTLLPEAPLPRTALPRVLPILGTAFWILASAGPQRLGLALGTAGLELFGRRLARLPAAARLVFWAPFLR